MHKPMRGWAAKDKCTMERFYGFKLHPVIEAVNGEPKNVCQIEHTRHRSVDNFATNLLAGMIAYNFAPDLKKSSIEAVTCVRKVNVSHSENSRTPNLFSSSPKSPSPPKRFFATPRGKYFFSAMQHSRSPPVAFPELGTFCVHPADRFEENIPNFLPLFCFLLPSPRN